jgi:hypothetical protein
MCPPTSIAWPKSRRGGRVLVRRLVYVAFFIEVGLLLIVLPWSTFWERNYFATVWPVLQPIFTNLFVRGAVTGLGLVNLAAGVSELLLLFVVRDRHDTPLGGSDSPSGESYANGSDAQAGP